MSRINVKKTATIVCVCVLLLPITGCERTMVKLDSLYEPSTESVNYRTDSNKKLLIRSINDIRKDKYSLGALGLADVSSDDIVEWLSNAFRNRGYLVGSVDNSGQSVCRVDVSLKLAYIRSSSTSKATNIVLGVNHHSNDELTYYRGTHAGLNWNSLGSEIKNSFNYALENAMTNMEAGLQDSCNDVTQADSGYSGVTLKFSGKFSQPWTQLLTVSVLRS